MEGHEALCGYTRQHIKMKALIDYIETLTMVGGDHDGEPFVLLPWERRFIRGAFGVDGDAAVSVSRGNGKSAVVAGDSLRGG